ncbi:SCO family protein [Vibrio sp. ZSDZ65]|uniref:SCO family protein n=1 Tax=Vibrio qingdaonensis TaxID=2829491 RepID=A0A9X3HXN4_9VIBR|nr:SCO family protein [Vibrio qingdaonensis]MCW8347509.1 SCO family protein [Vibrio qingdaonensis]
MKKKWLLLLIGAFAVGIATNITLQHKKDSDQQADAKRQIEETSSAVLFGENDNPIAIFDQQDSRTRIVYFGFTRCPDVCPTSLAMLAGALNQIDESSKTTIRPLFISLDPERDAAAASAEYAHYFHPMIEGLSAPLDVTTPLAHRYGVIFRKTELEGSKLGYTLDHSSYFYFLKPDGTLIEKVPHTLTPAPIIEAIKRLNNQG